MADMRQLIESLSPRQFEILVCVARHLSSREIGILLRLSPATVDSHIAAALQKLGLATRRDAALRMIEFGFAPPAPESEGGRPHGDFHHGGEPPSNPHELPAIGRPISSGLPGRGPAWPSGGEGDGSPELSIRSGMGRVIVRYLLDAFYISLFFIVMSAVAFGVHWVVIQIEKWHIDPTVLFDAFGVVAATGLLTFRFVRAMVKASD
jgi:DNA-binding CsgD family transcriptional regulator